MKFNLYFVRYHNEVEVTEKTTEFTRIEEGDNYKLIVKEVTRELSGKYSCIVSNDLGKNDCSATFTVKSRFDIIIMCYLRFETFL